MIHKMGDDWDDYALKHSKFPVVLGVNLDVHLHVYIHNTYFRLGAPGTEACVTTDKFLVKC